MSKRKRILLLGDINSIHLQKWIVGLKNDFEIFVFSLDPIEANINGLENVQIFSNQKKTTNRKGKLSYLKSLKKFRKLHKEVKPDFVDNPCDASNEAVKPALAVKPAPAVKPAVDTGP